MLEDPSEREIPCVSAALGAAEGFLSRTRNSRDARIKVAALRCFGSHLCKPAPTVCCSSAATFSSDCSHLLQ